VPDILVERYHGCEQCWRKTLAQVDDDLESRYLAAKRDQLEFVLSVPNHGELHGGIAIVYLPFVLHTSNELLILPWLHVCMWYSTDAYCCCSAAGKVEGVLWYFPYENDQETVPLDPHTMGRMLLISHRDGPTQAAGVGQGVMTQVAPSQLAAWQSQKGHCTQVKRQAELEPEQDAGK
jgi:hypothetical protein